MTGRTTLPSFTAIILAAFAVYRVAFMVAREEGPADVFDRLRAAAQRLPAEIIGNRTKPHWIARGLSCPLCISFWLALPAALLVTQGVGVSLLTTIGLWLSIAGICLFLFRIGGT